MKMLLLGIVVIGAIALGIWTYHFQRREPSPDSSTLRVAVEKKAVPMVMVWFVSLDHPGTGEERVDALVARPLLEGHQIASVREQGVP